MAYHIHEPLGVVGQIIPRKLPRILMAAETGPRAGAGNCVVLSRPNSTPISILILAEPIADPAPGTCSTSSTALAAKLAAPLATRSARQDRLSPAPPPPAASRPGRRQQP